MGLADMCLHTQKIFIGLCGIVLLCFGAMVAFTGVSAQGSDSFTQMTTMASEATNGAFDFSSFMVLLIVLGIAVVVLGLLACWASLREHRCFLCSYVCFAVVIGPLLLCICCGMAAYWKAEWPNLVKTTNRICGPNAPQAFEAQLNCTNPLFATQRRLETADIGPIATLRVAHSLLSEAASPDGGRRLFPGTAEESLLVRTCDRLGPELCSSPCALVDLICQTPPGYDPLKACICDRSGPRNMGQLGIVPAVCNADFPEPKMCQPDGQGRRMGVFCTPQEHPDHAGEEACFILPTADCEDRGWEVKPSDLSPSYSSGPCVNPDARSKLALESYEMGMQFVGFTFILGVTLLVSACCSFCLFVELHTGKPVSDHARGLANDESYEKEDNLSRADSEDEWKNLTHVE